MTETTRTLKEMLVSSTVENEASTNANMTALCTLYENLKLCCLC